MPKLSKEIVIRNPSGLHARPAAMFVQIASKYNSKITVSKDGEKVNGKSIMGILTLGAEHKSVVILEVEGDDAELAIKDLEAILNSEERI